MSAVRSGRPDWRTLAMLGTLIATGHWGLLRLDSGRPVPPLTSPFDTRVIELTAMVVPTSIRQGAQTIGRPKATPASYTPTPALLPAPAPGPANTTLPKASAESIPEPAATTGPEPGRALEPAPEPEAVAFTALPLATVPVLVQVVEKLASVTQSQEPIRQPRESALALGMVAVPPPVRLLYRVESNKFPFRLSGELLWRHDGLSYEARLSMSAFGQSRVQSSRGDVGAQGLLPLRFSDKYRSEVAAHFERDKGRISFSANTPAVPLLAGAQDYLSVTLQLAAMIGGEPARYPVGTSITVQVVGPREAEIWLFTVEGKESLRLPRGEQETLKLVRLPRRQFDQGLAIWLAPAMNWLPVRLRMTESNGDYLDQKWESSEAPS